MGKNLENFYNNFRTKLDLVRKQNKTKPRKNPYRIQFGSGIYKSIILEKIQTKSSSVWKNHQLFITFTISICIVRISINFFPFWCTPKRFDNSGSFNFTNSKCWHDFSFWGISSAAWKWKWKCLRGGSKKIKGNSWKFGGPTPLLGKSMFFIKIFSHFMGF